MSAQLQPSEARFETLTPALIETICSIERAAYTHPWSPANFADSLRVGYHCQVLMADDTLLGYFIAMKGVDEVHLLNITVAPPYQRQGWARLMLDALALWSRAQDAQWLWLEVRASNQRALDLYTRQGFVRIATRKDYYPAPEGGREDAIIMRLPLDGQDGTGAEHA